MEQVGGIGSTGQLIPVIIGVGSMGHILMKLVKDIRNKRRLVDREDAGQNLLFFFLTQYQCMGRVKAGRVDSIPV